MEPMDERREALVEAVAREIRLRGLTGPAVHFLEASRPYRPLVASPGTADAPDHPPDSPPAAAEGRGTAEGPA